MSSLNKVTLIGRLGKEPEIRATQTGDKIANFSLATSENWKDQYGNKQERTEWHKVVIFGKLAEVVEKYVGKGDQIYLEGKLTTRKWEKDGVDHYTTEVQVTQIGGKLIMLGSKDKDTAPAQQQTQPAQTTAARKPVTADAPFDDEIPF